MSGAPPQAPEAGEASSGPSTQASGSGSPSQTSVGGSQVSGDGSMGEIIEPGSQSEEDGDEGLMTFDRAIASRHAYLGDNLEDLERRDAELLAGAVYHVPYFPLEGIVLCPGDTLPMRLQHPLDQQLAQRALQAAPPLNGLIAVSCVLRRPGFRAGIPDMGCLAEIRQLRLQEDGAMSLISKGCHRVVFVEGAALHAATTQEDLSHVAVRVVIDDEFSQCVPRPVGSLAAFWPPWAYRPFDADYLARSARGLLHAVVPKAPAFQGGPLALSFWLVSNLPLEDAARQQLLEASSAAERLRLEVQLLREMGKVRCTRCSAEIGDLRDVVQMSEEGVSGVYVNPHGVVHDIFMLRKAQWIRLEGQPSTDCSWFPGYAWTVAYCRGCWHHLGWRFTAAKPGLKPFSFWGLRRTAIQGAVWGPGTSGSEGDGSQQDGSEEGG